MSGEIRHDEQALTQAYLLNKQLKARIYPI